PEERVRFTVGILPNVLFCAGAACLLVAGRRFRLQLGLTASAAGILATLCGLIWLEEFGSLCRFPGYYVWEGSMMLLAVAPLLMIYAASIDHILPWGLLGVYVLSLTGPSFLMETSGWRFFCDAPRLMAIGLLPDSTILFAIGFAPNALFLVGDSCLFLASRRRESRELNQVAMLTGMLATLGGLVWCANSRQTAPCPLAIGYCLWEGTMILLASAPILLKWRSKSLRPVDSTG